MSTHTHTHTHNSAQWQVAGQSTHTHSLQDPVTSQVAGQRHKSTHTHTTLPSDRHTYSDRSPVRVHTHIQLCLTRQVAGQTLLTRPSDRSPVTGRRSPVRVTYPVPGRDVHTHIQLCRSWLQERSYQIALIALRRSWHWGGVDFNHVLTCWFYSIIMIQIQIRIYSLCWE